MPLRGVRLSVRVSVTFVYSVEAKRYGNIPTGSPLTAASNEGGVGKNRDSRPISCFIACSIEKCYTYSCTGL